MGKKTEIAGHHEVEDRHEKKSEKTDMQENSTSKIAASNASDDVYMCVAAIVTENVTNQLSEEQLEAFKEQLSLKEVSLIEQGGKSVIYGSQEAVESIKNFLDQLVLKRKTEQSGTEGNQDSGTEVACETKDANNCIKSLPNSVEEHLQKPIIDSVKIKTDNPVNDAKSRRRTRGKKIDVLSVLGSKRAKRKNKSDEPVSTETEAKKIKLEVIESEVVSSVDDVGGARDETEGSSSVQEVVSSVDDVGGARDETEGSSSVLEVKIEDDVKLDGWKEEIFSVAEKLSQIQKTSSTEQEKTGTEVENKCGVPYKKKFSNDVLQFLRKVSKDRSKKKVRRHRLEGVTVKFEPREQTVGGGAGVPVGEVEGSLMCELCGYKTHTFQAMRLHRHTYHEEHKHECDICFCTYSMRYMLERHRQYHFEKDGSLKIAAMALHKAKLVELDRKETLLPHLVKQIEEADIDRIGVPPRKKDQAQGLRCPICFKILSSNYYLRTHVQNVHQVNKRNKSDAEYKKQAERYTLGGMRQNIFTCPICNFNTSRIQNFNSHYNIHVKPALYFCDLCDYINKKQTEVRRHKRNAHNDKVFECDRCDTKFRTQPQLTSHIKQKHTLSYSRMCPECGKVLGTTYSYKNHLLSHHSDPAIQPGDKIMCQKCGRIFRTLGAFQSHMRKYHVDVKDESQLSEEKAVSEGVLVLDDGNLFQCKKCMSYSNSSAREVRQHIVRVHLDRKFKCNQCDKTFPREKFLHKHVALHHLGLESVDCPECEKTFKNKSYLAYHMKRVHKRVTAFDCDVCQKSFFKKSEYESHLEIHKPEDERNWKFECEICNKRFLFKSNVDYHMLEHTGGRPHMCPICTKQFKTSAMMKSHMLSHSDEKPHNCPHCDKSFKMQKNLDLHLLKHGGDSFMCSACCRHFPHKRALEKHVCRAVRLNIGEDQIGKIEIISDGVDIDDSHIYSIPDVPDPSAMDNSPAESTDIVNSLASSTFTHSGATDSVAAWSEDTESTTYTTTVEQDTSGHFHQVLPYAYLPTSGNSGALTDSSNDNTGSLMSLEQQGENTIVYESTDTKGGEEYLQLVFSEVKTEEDIAQSNQQQSDQLPPELYIKSEPEQQLSHYKQSISTCSESQNPELNSCDMSGANTQHIVIANPLDSGHDEENYEYASHSFSSEGADIITGGNSGQLSVYHTNGALYMCGICNQQFTHEEDIQLHVSNHHTQVC